MLRDSYAFSGFTVQNLQAAEEFYGTILGLAVEDTHMGLRISLAGGGAVFIYEKENHMPATYTILNFPVDDIDMTIDDLASRGITFERYDNLPAPQDEKGILRGKAAGMGPDIAWFKDPAGNILSVLSN
jgi:predicted enzyme related to lactoylglutathione lyase